MSGLDTAANRRQHLRSIEELSVDDLVDVLDLTDHMVEVCRRPVPKVPALRGRTVLSLFFEDSTRTRLSFETAAKRLSADTMTFSASSSSVNKGESLRDTVETLDAMGIDAAVVRHRSSGVPWQVSRWTGASIINAGDGWHQHPTQALLDAYTIRTEHPAARSAVAEGRRPLEGSAHRHPRRHQALPGGPLERPGLPGPRRHGDAHRPPHPPPAQRGRVGDPARR